MSIKNFNQSFRKLYESVKPNNILIESIESDLVNALNDAAIDLEVKGSTNIKDYEIAFQNAIENIVPDKSWWEVTSSNIFMDLFENRDVKGCIERIISNLNPEFKLEDFTEISDTDDEFEEKPIALSDDDDIVEEDLDKPLNEKIPKDLAKAYKDSDYHAYSTRNSDYKGKTDFEASEYIEITPEQALEYKAQGNLPKLRILKDGQVLIYYSDGKPNTNYRIDLKSADAYERKTGKKIYDSRYVPLKHILSIADKIYVADEVALDDDKWEKRVGNDSAYVTGLDSEREANLKLGKSRDIIGWSRDFQDYDVRYYERAKQALATVEQEWADGTISRVEYEKQKARYEEEIMKYEKKMRSDRAKEQNARANARNYSSNVAATEHVRTYKDLRSKIQDTQRSINRASAKAHELTVNGSNSEEYDYYKKQISKLRADYYAIKSRLDYYEELLAKADDGRAAKQAEDEMQKDMNKLADLQSQMDALFKRNSSED